jgi:hypothetical protein
MGCGAWNLRSFQRKELSEAARHAGRISYAGCAAKRGQPRRFVSPLCKAVHQRVTPKLAYLQAKWAAHLPYRQTTELLREVLPLDKGISFGSTRRRIIAVGSALDAQIERDIASGPKAISAEQVRESTTVGCVSDDSAWLSFCSSRKAVRDLAELKSPWAQKLTRDRHVNIVAGRATLADRTPRLYAYVQKLVPSAPARLDQFLFASGVAPDERVTVISDDAGEFGKAVDGSRLARGRILDWFHIAMKFKAARNSVLGSQTMEPHLKVLVARSAGIRARIRDRTGMAARDHRCLHADGVGPPHRRRARIQLLRRDQDCREGA